MTTVDELGIGETGIWTFNLDLVPAAQAQEVAAELEGMGWGAIWIPEAVGREAFTSSAVLLAGTSEIGIATGIASIWGRDPMAAAGAHKTLSDAYPGRFLLGLGVSHQPAVEGLRHQPYDKPYSRMVEYLEGMDAAPFMAAGPATPPRRVLAALGPKMLALAAERADGAHPYFVPPEHTAIAREALGEGPVLAVEQAVVLETDPTRAREVARSHTRIYTGLPNYANNLKRLGLDDDDFPDAGSDRLVDTVVAWGSMDDVVARVQAHRDAGADHVCVQLVTEDLSTPPLEGWRRLAEALLG